MPYIKMLRLLSAYSKFLGVAGLFSLSYFYYQVTSLKKNAFSKRGLFDFLDHSSFQTPNAGPFSHGVKVVPVDQSELYTVTTAELQSIPKIQQAMPLLLVPSLQPLSQPREATSGPTVFRRSFVRIAGKGLKNALLEWGFEAAQVDAIIKSIPRQFLKRCQVQPICVSYSSCNHRLVLESLSFSLNFFQSLRCVLQKENSYRMEKIKDPVVTQFVRLQGVVRGHLAQDLRAKGVPIAMVSQVLTAVRQSPDALRLCQKQGVSFAFLCKRLINQTTRAVAHDGVLFATVQGAGKSEVIYQYQAPGEKKAAFYKENGVLCAQAQRSGSGSIAFCRPVRKARLESRFGARFHPILRRVKHHKGVDYAAPHGTPVQCAMDGVVESVCWYGHYGRYIKVKHGGGFKTAYAHLSRYAKNLKTGDRVTQGQVIGYVGSSGRTTGAHLHFEVLRGGTQVNPLAVGKVVSQATSPRVVLKNFSQFKNYVTYIKNLTRKSPTL